MLLPTCEEDDVTEVYCSCSGFISVQYEPVGRWFEACLKRQRSEKSVSHVEEHEEEQSDSDSDNEVELTDDENAFLLSLDSAEWKKQDHYRVLGLSHLRSQATDEDVKRAYRKKVLKHHPDKKSKHQATNLPPGLNEHNYFTCITKAYESLSTIDGRQGYDSVDPTFDDSIPSYSTTSKQDFFETFATVFKNNSIWSKIKPVPQLGDMNSSQEDVNGFYSFWYDFKSWRNYSYLDEEDTEKAESREERRWMERENRHMRQKRKKDEVQRIRNLVDCAFQNDPRLKKFKEEEKQKKLEKKQAKEQAVQEKEKQRLIALESERKLKEQAEQEAKEKAQKEKKEKDKLKKAATRDRKIIRQTVKSENFFGIDADEIAALERLEKSLENLSLQNLQELREAAEGADKTIFKDTYLKYSTEILEKLKQQLEEKKKKEEAARVTSSKQSSTQATIEQSWSDIELQLLVKATTLFAVGTASRWEVIAAYINEHSGDTKLKTGKQVINKVKSLKKLDPSLKEEVNKMAFKNLEKATTAKLASPIASDISVKDSLATTLTNETPDMSWSSDEQKLLEQALKTYGANTPERWDKIASVIPSRTKKECMKRYKELVEMVKAKKKAAQSAAAR